MAVATNWKTAVKASRQASRSGCASASMSRTAHCGRAAKSPHSPPASRSLAAGTPRARSASTTAHPHAACAPASANAPGGSDGRELQAARSSAASASAKHAPHSAGVAASTHRGGSASSSLANALPFPSGSGQRCEAKNVAIAASTVLLTLPPCVTAAGADGAAVAFGAWTAIRPGSSTARMRPTMVTPPVGRTTARPGEARLLTVVPEDAVTSAAAE